MHSGHGAQYDPEAIREVERILKENLTDKNCLRMKRVRLFANFRTKTIKTAIEP